MFLLGLSTAGVARPQQLMSDQLFGISHDPQKVHFEKMPPRLLKECAELRGRYLAAWIYGHFKTGDSEYFLISGLMKFHSEEPGGPTSIAPEEGDGLIVALRDSKCLVDEAGYFFTQKINPAKHATPVMVPPTAFSAIFQDAFKRYVTAFGGKQEFLKHVKPNVAFPPVQEQLEIFRKSPS
jgi:hypothetical protein